MTMWGISHIMKGGKWNCEKVIRAIRILGEVGNELREPDTKYLEDGILELRIKQANNISRVLYFFMQDRNIILTHGFIKKTQKTPAKEIERCKKYKKDYIARMKEER